MLFIPGQPVRHCDGLSRRTFLTAGGLGVAGFTLADLLRADEAAGRSSSRKAIINVHLDGGPPHMDMIDLKPEGAGRDPRRVFTRPDEPERLPDL
jgi:hypothetical protein